MTRRICHQTVREELSADYTLPDYRPEIRRLLHVGATVLPPAKYVGGGRVELDGIVEYQVLYVGADGELYSAPLTGEYSVVLPLEGADEIDMAQGVCVLVSSRAESVTPRVTGPRKLSLRTRLWCDVTAFGKQMMDERVCGEADPDSICVMQQQATMAELSLFSGDEITLAEQIDQPVADTRVVSADGSVMMHHATLDNGEVALEGDLYLCLLCAYPNGGVETIRRKIPFSSRMDAPVPGEEGIALRAQGQLRELTVSVEEGKILCEARLSPEVRVMANRTLSYQSDLFSTQCPSEIEYGTYALPVHRHSFVGNLTQSERKPLSEIGMAEGATVIAVYGTSVFESGEEKDGKYILTGQSRYALICEREGEYSVSELSLPLRYVTDRCEGEVSAYDATATVIDCRARVNGEVLELDAELAIGGTLMGEQTVRAVEAVAFGEQDARPSGEMILCFPIPGESLWDVAKRYRVNPRRISGNPETDRYVVI